MKYPATFAAILATTFAATALPGCGTDSPEATNCSPATCDAGPSADSGGTSSGGTSSGGTSSGGTSSGGTSSGGTSSGGTSSGGTPTEVIQTPEKDAFAKKLKEVLTKASTLKKADFLAEFTPANAPKSETKLGYDPLKAGWMQLIDDKLKLNADEKAKLAANGFVVSERWSQPTMAEALLDVFKKDLPILVTTDMILQALHASYDDILKGLEREVLFGSVESALSKTHGKIAKVPADPKPFERSELYADFYLTVARSLLAGSEVAPVNANQKPAVTAMLKHVAALKMTGVEIFGRQRVMDFSQFKPRGHYEGDEKLERYFRCMIWLGRADFRFVDRDKPSAPFELRPEELGAAILLDKAANDAGAMAHWHQANDLITLMVGPVDYLDFSAVSLITKDAKISVAKDLWDKSESELDTLKLSLLGGKYGTQQIASHWLSTNPYSDTPEPLPVSFAFLGQRFVVDSYVFANVVYDRIVHNGQKVQRVLPNPLDAMFVLGNDHALTLLADDLLEFPYHGALLTLRFLVDAYDPAFWEDNVYNLWLSALRTLNKPTTSKDHPSAMKTTAWHDKTARTQLASWAQLRHDTILYAKQSYTGGVACEHPDGFVEPYPEFYGSLAKLADVSGQALLNAPFENKYFKTQVEKFFANWKTHMLALEAIAKKELKHEQLSAEDIAFLKKTIVMETMCGGPIFNGWYTSLYFQADNFDKFKPTIADVHTNPNKGPLPGPNVLHVATSDVNLMVFTSDTCGTPEAFVGPVFRYHEVDVKEIKRLSDKDWEGMLKDGTAPPQPKWTSSFVVGK